MLWSRHGRGPSSTQPRLVRDVAILLEREAGVFLRCQIHAREGGGDSRVAGGAEYRRS